MIGDKTVLGVVTARKGSQGILGKNYKMLADWPLVSWSIMASLASDYVDLTVVSSNCEHVKEIVDDLKSYWLCPCNLDRMCKLSEVAGNMPSTMLEFIPRPDEISGPMSKNEDALIHAYEYAKEHFDIDPDIIINLQPTSPIRRDLLLDRALQQMQSENADSLLTVNCFTPFFWRKKDGQSVAEYDYKNRPMRQELFESDMMMHDNGNLYIMTKDILLRDRCRIGGKVSLMETDKFCSLQIDEPEDFDLIEKLAQAGLKLL